MRLFDVCSCVSNHTVLLVAAFLHKSPFPPYQRGFFCNDDSIRLTHKSSTVSNTVLTAVGVSVPVVSVSPAVVLQENWGAHVGTLTSSSGWLVTPQKTRLVQTDSDSVVLHVVDH